MLVYPRCVDPVCIRSLERDMPIETEVPVALGRSSPRMPDRKLLRYRARTTMTGTFADCATATLTAPRRMPANPPRP